LRIDTGLATTAIVALGLSGAVPQWAAAQAAPGDRDECKRLWSQLEAAAKVGDLEAAGTAAQDIEIEPHCNRLTADANKVVVEGFRALDARMEREKAAPEDRLAKLEVALEYGMAWDIYAKVGDLLATLPGKLDHARISMAYDNALLALDEMPVAMRPPPAEIDRLARLAYEHDALSKTPAAFDEGKPEPGR
jgi:hypothetical protein